MENTILISMIIGLIVGSVIGGVILLLLAKFVGQISNVTFGNSFLVCFISTILIFFIWYLIGADAFRMGFIGLFFINLLILSASYIIIGKLIWKCDWLQSVKANIIWIIVYAIFLGYGLSKIA